MATLDGDRHKGSGDYSPEVKRDCEIFNPEIYLTEHTNDIALRFWGHESTFEVTDSYRLQQLGKVLALNPNNGQKTQEWIDATGSKKIKLSEAAFDSTIIVGEQERALSELFNDSDYRYRAERRLIEAKDPTLIICMALESWRKDLPKEIPDRNIGMGQRAMRLFIFGASENINDAYYAAIKEAES